VSVRRHLLGSVIQVICASIQQQTSRSRPQRSEERSREPYPVHLLLRCVLQLLGEAGDLVSVALQLALERFDRAAFVLLQLAFNVLQVGELRLKLLDLLLLPSHFLLWDNEKSSVGRSLDVLLPLIAREYLFGFARSERGGPTLQLESKRLRLGLVQRMNLAAIDRASRMLLALRSTRYELLLPRHLSIGTQLHHACATQ
jgi:hypothetical protein